MPPWLQQWYSGLAIWVALAQRAKAEEFRGDETADAPSGPGRFSNLFECAAAPPYRQLLGMVAAAGWKDPRVFTTAWELWQGIAISFEHESSSGQTDELRAFNWRTGLQTSPGLDLWLIRMVVEMGKTLVEHAVGNRTASPESEAPPGALDCPYGFLAMQYALLVGFQITGNTAARHKITNSLVASMEVLLDSPYHTFDFLESTLWRLSSHDIAVNLDSDVHYESFHSYVQQQPVLRPRLLPWHGQVAASPGFLELGKLQAAHQSLLGCLHSATPGPPGPVGPLRVALLQLHDGTAAEIWSSTRAALQTIVGLYGPGLNIEPEFYFTQVKALRGTDLGHMLESSTFVGFDRLQSMKLAVQRQEVDLTWVRDSWLPQQAPSLFASDLLICSEPFWLCPLVAHHRSGAMLGVLHMALLNEFPSSRKEDLDFLWEELFRMFRRYNVVTSVACRLTGEQVLYQIGFRVPYVPFLGLHVEAHYNPAVVRRALLFRNNRQHMIAFRGALRLFLEELHLDSPVPVIDMNEVRGALSFGEIAEFHAVVLLPHGPNALRLSDLYAAAIPMVIPGEPLVHKFVWASRTFAGFDSESHYRERAPEALRQSAPSGHSWEHPFSIFAFLQAWSIHRLIDARRYWYQYTEWATLPHLLRFESLPDLLTTLARLTREEALQISRLMARHHLVLASEALGWWRAALAVLVASSGVADSRVSASPVRGSSPHGSAGVCGTPPLVTDGGQEPGA